MLIHNLLVVFAAASFLCYAASTLTTKRMAIEFKRYGFSDKRVFIASSQLLGALGLLVGLTIPLIGILASACFTVQMVCAVVVRHRIGDPLFQKLPAIAFLAIFIALFASFSVRAIS